MYLNKQTEKPTHLDERPRRPRYKVLGGDGLGRHGQQVVRPAEGVGVAVVGGRGELHTVGGAPLMTDQSETNFF